MPLSTVGAALVRHGLGKLPRLQPDEPANRYERPRPGELVHIDVKKLGRFARWLAGARALRRCVESARGRHPTLALAFDILESDSSIRGGLLAGALAYRLFVLLLPSA